MAKNSKKKVKDLVGEAVEKDVEEMIEEKVEEMLEEVLQEAGEEAAVEEKRKQKFEKVSNEPFSVMEYKLKIFENKIVEIPKGTKKVVVENLGGGDLYVDVVAVSFKAQNRLTQGQSKTFSNIDKLYIGSASRPTYRISLYK